MYIDVIIVTTCVLWYFVLAVCVAFHGRLCCSGHEYQSIAVVIEKL